MSKKARNWTRAKRKRIRERTEWKGPWKARRRRQDAQHALEFQRKATRFADMLAAAFRSDPENIVRFEDRVWRDDMSQG